MSHPLIVAAAVAIGGGMGAVARHGLTLAVAARTDGSRWPATLAVNLIGCLAIGMLWRTMEEHATTAAMRGLLLTGLLGGFTTFSAFGLDAVQLLETRRTALAALYVGGTVVVGIVLVRVGYDAATAVLGGRAAG